MQVSRGFSYTWDAARPLGERVLRESLRLNGQAITAQSKVRVTVNAFMAGGGDNFTQLKNGTDTRTGMMDVDALELYIVAHIGSRLALFRYRIWNRLYPRHNPGSGS